jgi:hypothetical protein
MKTNKPKVQKKVAKKAGKKELTKTLTERFLHLMNELGQEAEKIGVDISKVGLSAVKKLSVKLSGEKLAKKAAGHDAKSAKKAVVNHIKPAKKVVSDEVKASKKAPAVKKDKKIENTVKKAVAKARPAAQSVKVVPILTEENAANALAKKPVVKRPAKAPRKARTDTDANS